MSLTDVSEAADGGTREATGLFEAIPSVLILVSADATVCQWNRGAEKTLGVSAEQAVGKALLQVGVSWPRSTIVRGVRQCLEQRKPIPLEDLRYDRPDGSRGLLGVTLYPVQTGSSPGVLLFGADITDRRALQDQLATARRLESMGRLAAGIAHEINTPTQYAGHNVSFLDESLGDLLALVTLYEQLAKSADNGVWDSELAERIRRKADEIDVAYLMEEVPQAIRQAMEGISRVTRIVGAMREFSHANEDAKTPTNINKAIESAVTVARNTWKYVADVDLDLDPDLPSVVCLHSQFNQVILNLVTNAADAIEDVVGSGSNDKGCITIRTRRDGDAVEIAIADTGAGISEEIRTEIFDPFFTTKEVGKGTGQGLAICHSIIVEKHGGALDCESEVGRGTTFTIRMPITADDEAGDSVALSVRAPGDEGVGHD